jgi:multidrug efflux pump subunit AcrB
MKGFVNRELIMLGIFVLIVVFGFLAFSKLNKE